jgi:hypothetical protein
MVGGAAGSIAGQEVAIGLGMQDHFSWSQVGMAAIGAGVTAGIGAYAGQGGLAGKLGLTQSLGADGSLAFNAMAGNLATQGLGRATGWQEHFSWRSVAVSGLAAPVANRVGNFIQGEVGYDDMGNAFRTGTAYSRWVGNSGAQLTTSLLNGVGTQMVRRRVYGNGQLDYGQIAADAFGNFVGQSLVGELASQEMQRSAIAGADVDSQGLGRGLTATPEQVTAWGPQYSFDALDSGSPIAGSRLGTNQYIDETGASFVAPARDFTDSEFYSALVAAFGAADTSTPMASPYEPIAGPGFAVPRVGWEPKSDLIARALANGQGPTLENAVLLGELLAQANGNFASTHEGAATGRVYGGRFAKDGIDIAEPVSEFHGDDPAHLGFLFLEGAEKLGRAEYATLGGLEVSDTVRLGVVSLRFSDQGVRAGLELTGPKGGAITTLSRSNPLLLKAVGKGGVLGSGVNFGGWTGSGMGFVFSEVGETANFYSGGTQYSQYVASSARNGVNFVAGTAAMLGVGLIPVDWPAWIIAGAGVGLYSLGSKTSDLLFGEKIESTLKSELDLRGYGYYREISP